MNVFDQVKVYLKCSGLDKKRNIIIPDVKLLKKRLAVRVEMYEGVFGKED